MASPSHLNLSLTRRPVLGVGVATLAATLLGACGDNGGDGGSTPSAGAASGSAAPTSEPPATTAGASLVKLVDVPVGGAVSAKTADGTEIIIAQPAAGTVAGFLARCTHKGCTVAPTGNKLNCPCHGSVFDALTGKNISGPAPSPLASFGVKVEGGDVIGA